MKVMGKENIVILESSDYAPKALEIYKTIGKVTCFNDDEQDIGTHLEKATILIVRLGMHMDSAYLSALPHLKYIVSPTTGLNHIDLEFCSDRNIQVLSLKNEKEFLKRVTATAEHTMGLMLALIRGTVSAHLSVVQSQEWDRDKFCGRELSSLNLGILGFGRLGQIVANYAKLFGMSICAHDPNIPDSIFKEMSVEKISPDKLYAMSDMITVHVDYKRENDCLIGDNEFKQMKQNSFFINTSRGELVDEAAMIRALQSGRLAGAAVDVLQNEYDKKLLFNSPVFEYARTHNNLIITPHIGGCTIDSMRKTEIFLAQKLFSIL